MQCSGCLGTNLQHDDGKLVCEDCGEEIIGFHEEEEDDFVIGTAVSNRQSQSSQAMLIRNTLKARRESKQHEDGNISAVFPQLLVFEGAFYMLKAMADQLIQLDYVTPRIRRPLFQILSCWIHRKHSDDKPFHSPNVHPPRAHYLLAILALASSYIRSPLLPRDLCRLAVTRKIPYMTALTTAAPDRIANDETVRKVLSTDAIPTARKIIRVANNLALGTYAWPPLRKMYGNLKKEVLTTIGEKVVGIPESFPVGHSTITLLRLIRLLGLPDKFGARVLRWRELCANAICSSTNDPDSHAHLFDRPTEDSLIIDIINTMRLCYSRCLGYGGSVLVNREADMEVEWGQCKHKLACWLKFGNPEDIDSVMWSGLSPTALATLSGKRLSKYSNLVNAILTQRGEKGPELWGPFLREFESIATEEPVFETNSESEGYENDYPDENVNRLLSEAGCMYDTSMCKCEEQTFSASEGVEYMDLECDRSKKTSSIIPRKRLLTSSSQKRLKKKERKSCVHAEIKQRWARYEEDNNAIGDRGKNGDDAVRQHEDDDAFCVEDGRNEALSNEEDLSGRENVRSRERKRSQFLEENEVAEDKRTTGQPQLLDPGSGNLSNVVRTHEFNCNIREPMGIGLAWTTMICFFDGTNIDISGMEHERNGHLSLRMRQMVAMCNRMMKATLEFIQSHCGDYHKSPCPFFVQHSVSKMGNVQEEAINAVSTTIASSDGELLSSLDVAQQKWQEQLNLAKNSARTMLADVLSQRELLRSSLSTAAQLWDVLKPYELDENQSHESSNISANAKLSSEDHFLATTDQLATVKALQNVSHTICLVEFILAAPDALEKAHNALIKVQSDGLMDVHPGNAALLVDAHAVLTSVERLRDVILLDAPQNVHVSSAPSKCFQQACDARNLLEDIVIRGVFSNILPVSQTNPRLLVSAARVIDAEEIEDAWWRSYLHRCTNSERSLDVRPNGALNYKKQALSAVLESLQNIFREKERDLGLINDVVTEMTFNPSGDPLESSSVYEESSSRLDISNILVWIEERRQEKETLRRFVTPCVSPSFSIADIYEKEMHRQFMRLLTRLLHLVRPDGYMFLTEEDVIQLTTWYGKYKQDVGDQDESIDSFLSDVDRQRLIAALQKHCANSVDTQINSALSTEWKGRSGGTQNVNKKEEPRQTRYSQRKQGLRRNDLPDVILSFVIEHVKRMLSLKVQGLDYAIARTIAERMAAFQDRVRREIGEEQEHCSSEEYGHYICAVANNMARCLEYSEDLRDLFIPLALDQNRSAVENKLEGVIDGFRVSASIALLALTNGMTENLSIHASRFYAPNTGTEVMLDIVATLEDYFSEYEMHLIPYHFEHLAIESLKRIVVWYIAPFLRLSEQRVEEGVARRFTSLPTLEEIRGAHGDDLFEEDIDRDIISRRSDNDHNERRMSKGLSSMNGDAVVAQIDKDISNMTRFMRRKVVLYQKKHLEPTVEPMLAIRSLYVCTATAGGLADAFYNARAVIMRCVRPTWVSECGVEEQLTGRVAEVIWESRNDVNPVVLLEAITMIRSNSTVGSGAGSVSGKKARTTASVVRRPPHSAFGIDDGGDNTEEEMVNSLMWAPSPSKLRWFQKHKI